MPFGMRLAPAHNVQWTLVLRRPKWNGDEAVAETNRKFDFCRMRKLPKDFPLGDEKRGTGAQGASGACFAPTEPEARRTEGSILVESRK